MADTTQMNKSERQTLIRLVKQRFKLLETGIAARRSQLQRVVQAEIIEENKAEAEAFAKLVEDEVVEPIRALAKRMNEIIKEADAKGFQRQGYSWRSLENAIYSVDDHGTFVPKDLHTQVNARMLERMGDKPMGSLALQMEESRLIEQLLVGDLTSDEAKEYLEAIPTLENLVPLPNGGANKALLAADEEATY